MTSESLVARAVEGDVEAFTELVTRYQGMAFAYALSTLSDYQLAEDATQQALLTAWRNLASLRDPDRFGGWLRGIVRFECLRLVRDRSRHRSESLEAIDPADPVIDIERRAEVLSEVQRVLTRMATLPENQRVVAQLYYLADQPQAAVAEFLGLSVSTVNNRLREARANLRREGVYPVSTQPLHIPPFSERIGSVIRSDGQMIDARIERDARPPLLTAVQVGDAERTVAAYISQYLNDDVARLIVLEEPSASIDLATGAPVVSHGHVTNSFASARTIDGLVKANRTADERTVIATGIKVIDLFAPLVQGGVVALVGAMNVGKLVVVEELATRLQRLDQQATILVFLASPDELGVAHRLDVRVEGTVTAMMVPVADASPEALASSLQSVDTVLSMSRELADAGFYPAIDPLASRSNAVEASAIADQAREVLRRQPADGPTQLLRAYLTQPFFVAEPYTGKPGITIDPDLVQADVTRILNGEANQLEPDALMMRGSSGELE